VTILKDYKQFAGRHWETGTIHNFWAYRGITAPHTGEPISEALLLGISGGVVMGYFSFAYEGYDPMAHILTRNTFDPWDTMMSRLGVAQDILQTGKPETGLHNLLDTLDSGVPAIVWADVFSLAYNDLPCDEGMWGMFPILVFGHDDSEDKVWIADRAKVPLHVTLAELQAARARVKKDKFRLATLAAPRLAGLGTAVAAGIWDTIKLYTEKPPKGSKNNFGLAAFQWWAKLLTRPKTRLSWAKEFPAGRKLLVGLMSVYSDIYQFGKDSHAERDTYADFLDEASQILEKPALGDVARHFRTSAAAWAELGPILLPDDVPLLGEMRQLMEREHSLFLQQGNDSLAERQKIHARMEAMKEEAAADFPLNDREVNDLTANIAAHVLKIHDIEQTAVTALQQAMN
jgi:hypothetical protein